MQDIKIKLIYYNIRRLTYSEIQLEDVFELSKWARAVHLQHYMHIKWPSIFHPLPQHLESLTFDILNEFPVQFDETTGKNILQYFQGNK